LDDFSGWPIAEKAIRRTRSTGCGNDAVSIAEYHFHTFNFPLHIASVVLDDAETVNPEVSHS
jgi:hypothetical protein